MDQFLAFLQLGFEHILDLKGVDHMLFVIALTVAQGYKQWKKTALLVTAFTIGHSLSLILSGLGIVKIDQDLVEFLIPFTILLTALANLLLSDNKFGFRIEYLLASGFGLIHGMGFSNYFRAISFEDVSIIPQLLSFNIGVELGQLVIVFLFILIEFGFARMFNVKHSHWRNVISIGVAAYALKLILT